VRVTPSLFKVQLDRLAKKELPVMAVFLGTPGGGYKLGKVETTPTEVVVMGLQETLRDQVQIETRHIELFGKTRSFAIDVGLKPLNSNVYIKGPEKVNVKVEILRDLGQRQFPGLPVAAKNVNGTLSLEPERVTVTISGPKGELSQLPAASVEVTIPEQQVAGIFEVKPQVKLPGGFTLVEIKPAAIRVTVKQNK
jgi:YbbR domain-containing protein